MEFVTGVRKKETLELSKVLAPQSLDQEVLTDGSIYSIRNMGEICLNSMESLQNSFMKMR